MKSSCPDECGMFIERRTGKSGGYFHCHLCNKNIPESASGEMEKPIGKCSICGDLLFPMASDGKIVNICWNSKNHPRVP